MSGKSRTTEQLRALFRATFHVDGVQVVQVDGLDADASAEVQLEPHEQLGKLQRVEDPRVEQIDVRRPRIGGA